jgi:cytochrome b561
MLQHFLKVPPEAMQLANTEARYGALSQALHWATAICIVVVAGGLARRSGLKSDA